MLRAATVIDHSARFLDSNLDLYNNHIASIALKLSHLSQCSYVLIVFRCWSLDGVTTPCPASRLECRMPNNVVSTSS
jgi:hypothetical protein